MDFKKHLEIAWNLMLKNLLPLILITLVLSILSIVTFGILAPVMLAGYYQAILLMMRTGRSPVLGDLFMEMRLFLPLLGFSILVFFAILIGFSLLVVPGIAVVCLVAFACLYMLPLMTDKKMGLLDAVKKSWQMATTKGHVADHVGVVVLYLALIAAGSSVYIGILLTQPFASIFFLSVFEERMAAS